MFLKSVCQCYQDNCKTISYEKLQMCTLDFSNEKVPGLRGIQDGPIRKSYTPILRL